MALQSCRECGGQVSSEATACPHCGAPGPQAAVALLGTPAPPPPSKKRGKVGCFGLVFLVRVGIVTIVAIFGSSPPSSPSRTTSGAAQQARYRIKIERESYEHGYLKLVGTVENVGTVAGFSPSLKIRVHQGGTLLAEDTAWPAGMIFKRVSPGQRAAFESITRVPERSGSITYEVSMTEPYTIDYPKRR